MDTDGYDEGMPEVAMSGHDSSNTADRSTNPLSHLGTFPSGLVGSLHYSAPAELSSTNGRMLQVRAISVVPSKG